MAYNRGDSPNRRRGGRRRRKVCAFCTEADAVIDYKDVATLKKYVSERGKTYHRNMCKASESCHKRDQKSKTSRFNALHTGLIKDKPPYPYGYGGFFDLACQSCYNEKYNI